MKTFEMNMYNILYEKYSDVINKIIFDKSRFELISFISYNTHNVKQIRSNNNSGIVLENLETNNKYSITNSCDNRTGIDYLNYLPINQQYISLGLSNNAFVVGDKINQVRVNEVGMFLESFDLEWNIFTYYYDNIAVEELENNSIKLEDILYKKHVYTKKCLLPDRIISARIKDNKAVISVYENDEIVSTLEYPFDGSRTLYSIYYNEMRKMGYYENLNKNSDIITLGR